MGSYFLSPNAQKSLNGIKKYSTEKFGQRQTSIYLEKLRDRMRYLADNPKQGRARDKIKPGYYSYFEGSHTIYYKILADHIAIIDILHQSMEPLRHLMEED
ncbi:MAG: type II toxin-antitoxin system RelE/ParE family toxin [Nitrospinae bacterium]|nr:type II toxin-antitoxin system RelE/ParE family toxin [Nitrospinota bacterium]